MKKFWKISVCALAATFALSAVTACDKGEKEEKSNITADQVLAIGDSIVESLSGVQSFNFGLSMKTSESSSGYSMDNSVSVTAIANVGADDFSMKATASVTEKMFMQGMPEFSYDETVSMSAYVIDGFSYLQDEEDATGKTYIKSSVPFAVNLSELMEEEFGMSLEEIMEMLASSEGVEAPSDDSMELIKQLLSDEFTLIQKGDTTRVTLDLKQEFNDVFGYVGNLNVNTKVGDIVNFVLGQIDEELTWQEITGAIKDKGGYTVSTLVNVLDNELYSANGMRLQDLKDMLFASTNIYEMLVEELGEEAATGLAEATVADVVAQYGTLTVDNLIQMATEDEAATLLSMVTQVETMLSEVKLGDLMDDEDKEILAEVATIFKGIRADALNSNLIFTVKNDKITRVEVSFNVKISVSLQGETASTGVSYSLYAENFSQTTQAIALPTGITVDIYCNDCGWTATENDYCIGCQAYRCADCHDQDVHNG